MGRIVIAAYRPKKGKEEQLLELIHEHMPLLTGEGLVTDRKPVAMRSANGTIIEVFEWRSAKAMEDAHSNPVVQDLWQRFSEVCDYDIPVNVKEFHTLFPEFEPIN
jgi:hypothetical protein